MASEPVSSPYVDIIDDLLEGLSDPSIIVFRGDIGTGKAYVMGTIVKEWIERGLGRAAVISFMLGKQLILSEARKNGIDAEEYLEKGLLKIYEVTGISPNPRDRVSQLIAVIGDAVDFVRDGLILIYPGDLAFGGLDIYDLVNILGFISSNMDQYGVKILTSFTTSSREQVGLARHFIEQVARYVFQLNVEIPEAGVPRRYLTVIKPLRALVWGPRTLEVIPRRGRGVLLAHYGIVENYKVDISLDDRIYTGIEWFDRITKGIVRGTSILITGRTGTGKTLLLLTIAYNLAAKGERVLYISFEEPAAQLIQALRSIGYSYGVVEDTLKLVNINPRSITLTTLFRDVIKYLNNKFHIVVLDGLHALWKEFGDKYHKFLRDIVYYMKMNRNVLFMSKIMTRSEPVYTWLSSIVDGIIELHMVRVDTYYNRYICFKKMRLHEVKPRCYKYSIEEGVQLLSKAI